MPDNAMLDREDASQPPRGDRGARPEGASRGARPIRARTLVLIVEDDASLRLLLAELLEDAGYQVVVAENGAQALSLAERERPAVVLTDYTMPGLDGSALIHRLRTLPTTRHIPVIAMSATRPLPETLGDVPFIAKPFDVDVVLETIARHTLADPDTQLSGSALACD